MCWCGDPVLLVGGAVRKTADANAANSGKLHVHALFASISLTVRVAAAAVDASAWRSSTTMGIRSDGVNSFSRGRQHTCRDDDGFEREAVCVKSHSRVCVCGLVMNTLSDASRKPSVSDAQH